MTDAPSKNYKIVRFEGENIKKLKAVAIDPSGNIVEITGDNDQGKTSLLDSIYWALAGQAEIQRSPIRDGEEKAHITLDLGEVVVRRTFSRKDDVEYTTAVTVETYDGMRAAKPQSFLKDIIGQLTFDPLAFTRMKPKDQFDALKNFVPGVDFEKIAAENKKDFAERTDVNRRMKDARTQAAAIEFPEETPDEPLDESALVAELESVGEANADIERRRARREAVASAIQRRDEDNRRRADEIQRLQHQIKSLQDEIDEANQQNASDQKRLDDAGDLPEAKSTAEIKSRIEAARETNAAVARKKQRAELERQAKAHEQESLRLTKQMEDRESEKAKAIAAAKMPVDGLGFADDYITLDGQPFEQASQAQQLRASIALAMASNPKLRVLLIREGAFLDRKMFKLVGELADKYDVQVWLETVDSDRPGAIVIEDGTVRGSALQAAE